MKEHKIGSSLTYIAQWRPLSGGTWHNLTFPITSDSVLAQAMKTNTIYQFRYYTQISPPTSPTNIKVTNLTQNSLTITWTASTGLEA